MMLPMNYRSNETPRTSHYSHGGHVHSLMEKAYQPHGIGGDIYNAASSVLSKIKNHSQNIGNQVHSGINHGLGQLHSGINSGIGHFQSGVKHVSEEVPKLVNHGSRLAQELIKKHLS